MLVGTRATLAIESLTTDGLGRSSRDGLELLVPGAAPGDVVDVRIVARSRHHAVVWCEVVVVRERGPSFREASCPHAAPTRGNCGGCPVSHLTPAAAAGMKLAHVETALAQHQLPAAVSWTAADSELGYRNRAHYAAGRNAEGRVVLGSFAPRSRNLTPMHGCEILRAPLADNANALERVLTELKAPIYPERGGLRYASLRANVHGDTLLDLVITGTPQRWSSEYATRLAGAGSWRGISLSVNPSQGNAMRVSASTPLCGATDITEPLGPITLRLTASAFSQLNTSVCSAMYAWAANAARQPQIIWDWYCGAGGLGLSVAKHFLRPGLRVYGADSVGESIALARANALAAEVSAEYETVDLSDRCPSSWPAPDLVLVNPPRRGLDPPVLSALECLQGAELIYMSCNPVAFARDAARLAEYGWHFSTTNAFDMLPRTTHVELIAKAQRGAH